MSLNGQAVLFDSDGTLIDSTASIMRCWTRWAAEYLPRPDSFDFSSVFGRSAASIVADHLAAEDVPAATRRYEELEFADSDSTALPGVAPLLTGLPRDRWAVVTSASGRVARSRLRHTGVDAPVMVTADDVLRGKPHPEPFLLGARRLRVEPTACIVIEDAPAGLAAARAAGMFTIAVTTTHAAADLDADLVIGDLRELRIVGGPGGIVVETVPAGSATGIVVGAVPAGTAGGLLSPAAAARRPAATARSTAGLAHRTDTLVPDMS
ncbi:HAD-IA family hydrolase [Streptomyces sp.]|uniref:HAD-IA family hydrolase n=1 Tax=Streptomyces sp. TaxID=1931 RepID=UPI002F410B5D